MKKYRTAIFSCKISFSIYVVKTNSFVVDYLKSYGGVENAHKKLPRQSGSILIELPGISVIVLKHIL